MNATLGVVHADLPSTYGLGMYFAEMTDDYGNCFVAVLSARESTDLLKDAEELVRRIRMHPMVRECSIAAATELLKGGR